MPSNLSGPLRPPLGSATRPRGEGVWTPLGQEAAELCPGHADCLRSGLWGKSPPAQCPPARQRCASFPKRRRDCALLRSYPFSLIPAEHSWRLSPPLETTGEPRKTEETQLAPAIPPHFNSMGLGPLTAVPGLPTAARAPALQPESQGARGAVHVAPASPRGDPRAAQTRAPLWLGVREAYQGLR